MNFNQLESLFPEEIVYIYAMDAQNGFFLQLFAHKTNHSDILLYTLYKETKQKKMLNGKCMRNQHACHDNNRTQHEQQKNNRKKR